MNHMLKNERCRKVNKRRAGKISFNLMDGSVDSTAVVDHLCIEQFGNFDLCVGDLRAIAHFST